MKKNIVRITEISIHNFKNILSGNLSLENNRRNYRAGILGLYGQNGSGKTALIDSIELLKFALCGRTIPNKFADYINESSDIATLFFGFQIELPEGSCQVTYQFSIKKIKEEREKNTDVSKETSGERVYIFNEVLKCPILTDKQVKMGRLIDTDHKETFGPKSKKILLVGSEKETNTDLLVAKKLAETSSRSFLFSKELLDAIRKRALEDREKKSISDDFHYYHSLIENLVEFGNYGLFVINTSNSGLISLNTQPLIFKYEEGRTGALGTIMIPLESPAVIPAEAKTIVEKIITNMNIVLKKLIPNLQISVKDLGTQVLENGEIGNRIQLMSHRKNDAIALKYESEGIKKIISILQLLIVVYNRSSITVAIDELDAGVFEYLLGELLRIISEKGKGQLIFTSHNLRPLETLDRGFIAFTTTNPANRYVRMTNVKENNNLRDFYYRDIMLGEQSEELYELTNNAEIAFAFREAGESFAT